MSWLPHVFIRLMLLLYLAAAAQAQTGPTPPPVAGTWHARVADSSGGADLYLDLKVDDKGAVAGTVAAPWFADAYMAVPLASAKVQGGTIDLGVAQLRVAADSKRLTGKFGFFGPSEEVSFERCDSIPPADVDRTPPSAEKPVWSYRTGGEIWSTPAVSENRLYFGSDDGCVHAIQAADGSVVWKTATAGRVRAQPALNGDTLYVPSDDGKLYALKTADGRVVWSVEIDPKPVARSLPSADGQSQWDYAAASPIVVGDLILVGSASGDFLALELQTGRERWRCRSGAPIRSQAAVCAGRVVFGNWAGKLYALNISSGTQAWQFNARMPVVSRPAVSGQDVVVGSRYSYLWSIDANTGYMNWAFNYWWSWVESSAVVEGARAYVGSSDARAVFAIDCKMGRSLWRTRVSGYPWAAPAVSTGQVFIPTIAGAKDTVPQGFLYVLSAADGRIQRKLEIPTGEGCFLNGSCTQPVLTRRFVIIGATDGCLHAFRR